MSDDRAGFPGGPPTPPYGVNAAADMPPPPPPPPEPPTPTPAAPRNWRRYAKIAGAVGVIVVLVAAGVGLATRSTTPDTPDNPDETAAPTSTTTPPTTMPTADLSACGSIQPGTDPFQDPIASFAGIPSSGTGTIGKLNWAVNVTVEGQNGWELLGTTETTAVFVNTSDDTYQLVGRRTSDGAKAWALRMPSGIDAVTGKDPQLIDGQVWFSYLEGSDFRGASVNPADGTLTGCYKFTGPRYGLDFVAAGGVAYQLEDLSNNDTGNLSRLTAGEPAWTVSGEWDLVIGGDQRTVVLGSFLRRPYGNELSAVVGLDATTGDEKWRISVRDATAGATKVAPDTPDPVWDGPGTELRAGLFAMPYRPPAVTNNGAVTFVWSPVALETAYALEQPIPWSAYVVSLDTTSGAVRYAKVVPGSDVLAPIDGTTSVWVQNWEDTGEWPSTGFWWSFGPDGQTSALAPGSTRGLDPNGDRAVIGYYDLNEVNTLVRMMSGDAIVGKLDAEPGLSTVGTGRLGSGTWVGILRGFDGRQGVSVLVSYNLVSQGGGGGTGGTSGGETS